MADTLFLKANEVSVLLGVSQTKAYQIIKSMNEEMQHKGYLTVSGRVNKKYFYEKCYGQVPC